MNVKIQRKLNRYFSQMLTPVNSLLAKCDSNINNPYLIVTFDGNNEYTITLETPLILSNLPYRSGTNKKNTRLQIFIDGEFSITLDGNNYMLNKYGTRVSYCKIQKTESENLEPIDGYHYDMVSKTEFAHPIFHVQRNLKVINKVLSRTTYSIDESKLENRKYIQNMKIATAQFDIFSIIPMILADHGLSMVSSTYDEFTEILKKTTEQHPLKVNFSERECINKCFSNKELLSGYWYEDSVTPT